MWITWAFEEQPNLEAFSGMFSAMLSSTSFLGILHSFPEIPPPITYLGTPHGSLGT